MGIQADQDVDVKIMKSKGVTYLTKMGCSWTRYPSLPGKEEAPRKRRHVDGDPAYGLTGVVPSTGTVRPPKRGAAGWSRWEVRKKETEGGRGAGGAAGVWPQTRPGVCRRARVGERWGSAYPDVAREECAAAGDVGGGVQGGSRRTQGPWVALGWRCWIEEGPTGG